MILEYLIKAVDDSRGTLLRAIVDGAQFVAFLLPSGVLAWTSYRRADMRTLWDRVTNTMVRYRSKA